ncbi:MAG TPA: LamG domain-containing protein [Chitinophagaceae bacterium]|nr:LamG domain-containing protein [Chitinophagaceae bacterium]
MKRPNLGDFPKDNDPHFPLYPGGPLKFYTAFDGSSSDKLMNAVDSIRANFPSENPLADATGISGKAVQGNGTQAIKYPNANDFSGVTSCTISMWVNNTVNPNTELYFSLVSKDYWHESAAFLLVEHATPTACTFKFALQDHWVEYTNQSFTKPLFDGNWHHLAFTYDETTSVLKIYFDGVEVPTPGTSGNLGLGQLNLKSATNLVLAGWNKHAGITGPTDSWISGFTGKLDQFRLYGRALAASEVLALYNSKL